MHLENHFSVMNTSYTFSFWSLLGVYRSIVDYQLVKIVIVSFMQILMSSAVALLFVAQLFDYLIVIDFESTCWQGTKHNSQEISK